MKPILRLVIVICGLLVFIVPPSNAATPVFVNANNGTIVDTANNLTWLKNANCFGDLRTNDALNSVNNLASGQCSVYDTSKKGDWHISSSLEFYTFTDSGLTNETLGKAGFVNVQEIYWFGPSATRYCIISHAFVDGVDWYGTLGSSSNNSTYVASWPVRSGQHWSVDSVAISAALSYGVINSSDTAPLAKEVIVQNNSVTDSKNITIAITGLNAGELNVAVGGSSPCGSLTPTLSVGQSCTVQVSTNFSSIGSKNANLMISSGGISTVIPITASVTDTTAPTVSSFTVPATSTSLTVPITTFAAIDNDRIIGYLITELAYAPDSGWTGWSATAPAIYTFTTSGSKRLYGLVKDAAGNIGGLTSADVSIETNKPTISAFTIPATNLSLTVPILTFIATDDVGVTGYMITESPTQPLPTSTGWGTTAPNSYTFTSGTTSGSYTLYAWVKDAAGNIANVSAKVSIPGVLVATVGYAPVTINVAPLDSFSQGSGATPFGRTYTNNTDVILTAPAVSGLSKFDKWLGCNTSTGTACNVTSNGNQFVTARYLPQIISGSNHSLVLKPDGTVGAWGNNSFGLGDGTTTITSVPIQVSGLSSVTAIAAGTDHSIAVKSDDTVWTWGGNSSGQLGDGTITNSKTPVKVSNLSSVVTVAAGNGHSIAVKSDGTVWAWGQNSSGQLGDGTTSNSITPKKVSGLSSVVAVAAGSGHSIAVKSDGTVWAWGDNSNNQLGDGTKTSRIVPIMVPGLGSVMAVAAGYGRSIALKSDKTVWVWGTNKSTDVYGSYIDTSTSTPLKVTGLSEIVAVSSTLNINSYNGYGNGHIMALKSDGTVWAWGENYNGQLGDGTQTGRSTPVSVLGLSGVVAVAAGLNYSIAFKADGTVWAWGNNLGKTPIKHNIEFIKPVITSFQPVSPSKSLTLPITTVIATDNVSVTGYKITETATSPLASDSGWSATVPTSYTFPLDTLSGVYTLYAWAKDSAGNTSLSISASVTVDIDKPIVSTFTIPAISNLALPITTFGATDNVGVTGYKVTELSTSPLASDSGWTATVPTSYVFPSSGTKTLYAWAKDAAGNVSASVSANTLIDTTKPVISAFTLPTPFKSLTVPVSSFTATDDHGIGGYLIATSATAPLATDTGWSTVAPSYYTFAPDTTNGSYALYAWAKDQAGNISTAVSATIIVDIAVPTVTAFTIPSYINSLTIPVSSFTASDTYGGVTGYLINESATPPQPSDSGWSANAPTSYTFNSIGSKTLYAWAKDAAGNVSSSATVSFDLCADTASSDTNGTIFLPGTSYYYCNQNRLYKIAPKPGYRISDVLVDDLSVGKVSSYLFTSMATPGSHTISAAFEPDPFANWHQIAPGYLHTLAVRADGTMWAWGDNSGNQLGDGTATARYNPIRVTAYSDWQTVAAGPYHSLARRSTGTLYGWGDNTNLQLGASGSSLPVLIDSNTYWQELYAAGTAAVTAASSSSYSLARKTDGSFKQLGASPTGSVTASTAIDWVTLAAGISHTAAIRADGTLWGWGTNTKGQLGDNSITARSIPVQTGSANNWIQVAAGTAHTVGLQNNNTLWTWGDNSYGQLGTDQIASYSKVPVQIGSGQSWKAVTAGDNHTMALRSDGTIWAFGNNGNGQLGDGSGATTNFLVQAGTDTDWKSITAHGNISYGIKNNNTLYAWGANSKGQLGDTTTVDKLSPVLVGTNTNSFVIAATSSNGGSISPSGAITAAAGTSKTFSIAPLVGWHINGVTADGISQVISTSYTFTNVIDRHTISATFAPDATVSHTITASAGTGASISPNGTVVVADGTSQLFSISPQTNYQINDVLVDTVSQGPQTTFTFTNVTANHTIQVTASLIDTTVPTGSISINSGAAATINNGVTVTLSAADTGGNLYQMRFSLDNVSWSTWEAYATSKSYTLSAGDGTKNLYVQYRDTAGNISTAYRGTIILDTLAPTGSVSLNSGDTSASSPAMTATISATDGGSGVSSMQLSWDNITWQAWEAYAITKSVTASSDVGTKTLYIRFKDLAGNISAVANDSITLVSSSTSGPTLSVSTLANGTVTNNATLNISGTVSDSDGVAGLTINSKAVTITSGSFNSTVSLVTGANTITVVAVDTLSNSTTNTRTITLDQTTPILNLGTASCNKGGTATVQLTLTNVTGIDIASLGMDIAYDTTNLLNPTATIGSAGTAAGKSASSSTPATGTFRVGVVGFNSTAIANGTVATVSFTCSSSASYGSYALTNTPSGSNTTSNSIVLTGTNGEVTIGDKPGDCNGDLSVSISEVQGAINMFLGTKAFGCGVNTNNDSSVSISEVQKVINGFLDL